MESQSESYTFSAITCLHFNNTLITISKNNVIFVIKITWLEIWAKPKKKS